MEISSDHLQQYQTMDHFVTSFTILLNMDNLITPFTILPNHGQFVTPFTIFSSDGESHSQFRLVSKRSPERPHQNRRRIAIRFIIRRIDIPVAAIRRSDGSHRFSSPSPPVILKLPGQRIGPRQRNLTLDIGIPPAWDLRHFRLGQSAITIQIPRGQEQFRGATPRGPRRRSPVQVDSVTRQVIKRS